MRRRDTAAGRMVRLRYGTASVRLADCSGTSAWCPVRAEDPSNATAIKTNTGAVHGPAALAACPDSHGASQNVTEASQSVTEALRSVT